MTAEVRHADLGDVTITYALAGDPTAPPVIYVSGSGSDLRQQPNALQSPLVEHFHVLAYDHRGLGRSTTADRPPTMADFGRDLRALLDHVGWTVCSAVGVSFGGMVLQEAAVTEPSRFDRAVLACTSPGGAGGSSYPLHDLVGLDPARRRDRWVDALDTRNTDPERHALVLSVIEAMDARKASLEQAPGEVAQLLARRDHDCWDRLPTMTMPVLIAAGRHDGIAPPANQEAMHERLPDSRIEWFDGGHAFFVEDRSSYPAMIDFLSEADPDPSVQPRT
ncbi:alpha/beta fold hydrolase [Actinospongicola halichondriae]|uniref:alpha/beta fold hydrolase n=1 Tax=Actinospongicola halichondriae TaxID=3236844 RepID=UPI003D3A9A7B